MSPTALVNLATALESREFPLPFEPLQFRRLGYGSDSERLASELQALSDAGLSHPGLVHLLRAVAAERVTAQAANDRTELVWTGPDLPGARTRDTAVVVRDVFTSAERNVLVSTYVIFNGRQVFAPLAARMEQIPGMRVRLFVDVPRRHLDETPTNQLLRAFCQAFRKDHWPGERLPEVFYDPRSLETKAGQRTSLHAKAIVVDDLRVFVTSANFTEAAHDRNIECGVLIQSSAVASALTRQFDSLIEAGLLTRLPLA
jgi:phosphatidylserine/phosphatidylglycerophosphate/cardiolipin synthase-like enzyme